jgi:prepilin-type N-terminal cleavage/methylation domain-containing protein
MTADDGKSNNVGNLLISYLEKNHRHNLDVGFTLLEVLTAVLLIGILSAIIAPSWLGFTNRQRLGQVNDGILSALRTAQTEAKKTKTSYSAEFKIENNIPLFLVYPTNNRPISGWQNLGRNVEIKPKQILLYTNIESENKAFADKKVRDTQAGSGKITFDYLGALSNNPVTPLIIVVSPPKSGTNQASTMRRCVIIENLIGGMRIEKDDQCK